MYQYTNIYQYDLKRSHPAHQPVTPHMAGRADLAMQKTGSSYNHKSLALANMPETLSWRLENSGDSGCKWVIYTTIHRELLLFQIFNTTGYLGLGIKYRFYSETNYCCHQKNCKNDQVLMYLHYSQAFNSNRVDWLLPLQIELVDLELRFIFSPSEQNIQVPRCKAKLQNTIFIFDLIFMFFWF